MYVYMYLCRYVLIFVLDIYKKSVAKYARHNIWSIISLDSLNLTFPFVRELFNSFCICAIICYYYDIYDYFNVFVNWFDIESTISRTTCTYVYFFLFLFFSFFFLLFVLMIFVVSTVFFFLFFLFSFKYTYIWNIQSGCIMVFGSRCFNPHCLFFCTLIIPCL